MTLIIRTPDQLSTFAHDLKQQSGNLHAVLDMYAQDSGRQQLDAPVTKPSAAGDFILGDE